MQTAAALSAAALLAITAPFQKGLEAYKAGQFAEAAVALDKAVERAGTNQVELAESARIWSAAARAHGDEKAKIQGVKDLKSAYAAAMDPARRALAFELWKDAGLEPADLAPSKSPEDAVRTMQQFVTAGQIAQAENMFGPPLSDILALWRRMSEDPDSPLEMLEELPVMSLTAGSVRWPEGRVAVTANIQMLEIDLELGIRADGWAICGVSGTRSPGMGMMMGGMNADVNMDMAEPEDPFAEVPDAPDQANPGNAPAPKNVETEKKVSGVAPKEIQEWINQLGSPDAGVRTRARDALKNAGTAAYPALRDALNHPDPEVSESARGLLP